jgi:hypothetical protein
MTASLTSPRLHLWQATLISSPNVATQYLVFEGFQCRVVHKGKLTDSSGVTT